MGQEQANQWKIDLDEEMTRYHRSQWNTPYRSTVAFTKLVEPWLKDSRSVVDLGCGAGGPTSYMATEFPGTHFFGLDFVPEGIALAKQLANERKLSNCSFEVGDIYKLMPRKDLSGVTCIQTLTWLPDLEKAIDEIFAKLNPPWFAFSGQFYQGDISCKIEVNEASRQRISNYNVYSLPQTEEVLLRKGHKLTRFEPFDIDIDLPRPENPSVMRTYTQRLENGRRLQISGPLMLHWSFLVFERT
jgi:SAM-dependent methyltransferase